MFRPWFAGLAIALLMLVSWIVYHNIQANRIIHELEAKAYVFDKQAKERQLKLAQEAYDVYVKAWNTKGQADSLIQIGRQHLLNLDLEKSYDAIDKALDIYRHLGDRSGESHALRFIGNYYRSLARYDIATDYLHCAWLAALEAGDKEAELKAYSKIARSKFIQRSESIANLEFLITTSIDTEYLYPDAVLNMLFTTGYLSHVTRQTDRALFWYLRTIDLARQLNDLEMLARVSNNTAIILQTKGRFREALDHYGTALRLNIKLDNKRHAISYANLAKAHLMLGNYGETLRYLNLGWSAAQEMNLPRIQSTQKFMMGEYYATNGAHEEALRHYNHALDLIKPIEVLAQEATIMESMGRSLLELNKHEEALVYLSQASNLQSFRFKSISDNPVLMQSMGLAYASLDQENEALCYFEYALEGYEKNGSIKHKATVLELMGDIYVSQKRFEKAEITFYQALEINRQLGLLRGEGDTLARIAHLNAEKNDIDKALAETEAAIDIYSMVRVGIMEPRLRAAFRNSVQSLHELRIDLIMDQPSHPQQVKRGFEAGEQGRAQLLLENLQYNQGKSMDQSDQIKELNGKLKEKMVYRDVILKEGDLTDLDKVNQDIDALVAEISRTEAIESYNDLGIPKPASFEEIQGELLDEDTLLIDFALGEDMSWAWAVSHDHQIAYRLPGRADIETKTKEVYELLTARNTSVRFETKTEQFQRIRQTDQNYEKKALALSKLLFDPAIKMMGSKRLIIVPDGSLHHLPFSALPHPLHSNEPIMKRHAVMLSPSASTALMLKNRQRRPAEKMIALIADPVFNHEDPRLNGQDYAVSLNMSPHFRDVSFGELPRLPYTQFEARNILELFTQEQYFSAQGFEANIDFIKGRNLGEYKILHFATHGALNTRNPELSGLVLSRFDKSGNRREGFLTQNDIQSLQLNADLVVLSACSTALGKNLSGEGPLSLTQAFLLAGSSRVVASLWNVQDQATAFLITTFYKELIQNNQSPADALRLAKIRLFEEPKWRAPFYWGGFEAIGVW